MSTHSDSDPKKAPHIHLANDASHARAIVCGSPERAELIAGFLDGARSIARNREYHSFLGQHAGKPVLVTSHGVGSAGAAICFQELINSGVRTMIRIGTAGALYDDYEIGDIVVATAAARKDGVSRLMMPEGFPALADPALSLRLGRELSTFTGLRHRSGVVLTTDLFYPGLFDDELGLYQRAGAAAVEMECATLFTIAQLRGIRAGAVLVLDGNPVKAASGDTHYDPRPERLRASVEGCIRAALAALSESDA